MNLGNVQWRKSSRSNDTGACVEIAPLATQVAARDSKRPVQAPLAMDRATWATFAKATRAGRYDLG